MLAEGRVWFRGALHDDALAELDTLCALEGAPGERLRLTAQVRRRLKPVDALADQIQPGAHPVRLLAFSKCEVTNWALPWHQDRVVALKDRIEAPGFTNWSFKSGVWHAEPPIALLEQMIFARVHLDPTDEENGAMQISRGTGRLGKIGASDAAVVAEAHPIETCTAARGDVLFAPALTLHRSGPSRTAAPRRALRIDYCAAALPARLAWENDQ